MSSPPGRPLNVTTPVHQDIVNIVSDSESVTEENAVQHVEQNENENNFEENLQVSSAECGDEQPAGTGMSAPSNEGRSGSYASGMSEDSGVQRKRAKLDTEDLEPSVCLPSLPTEIAPLPLPNTIPEFWTGKISIVGEDAVSTPEYVLMTDRTDMYMAPPHYTHALDQLMIEVDRQTVVQKMMLVPVPAPIGWTTKDGDLWYSSIKEFRMDISVYPPGDGNGFTNTWFHVQYKSQSVGSNGRDEDHFGSRRKFRLLWPKIFVASWDLNNTPLLNGLNYQNFRYPTADLNCSTQLIPSPRDWRDAHGRLMFPPGSSFKFYIKINSRPYVWFSMPNTACDIEHLRHFQDEGNQAKGWPFMYWDPFNPRHNWYKVWNTSADPDQIPYDTRVSDQEKAVDDIVKIGLNA